jgi:uncharacterized repeat protein (TIGR02543 family)
MFSPLLLIRLYQEGGVKRTKYKYYYSRRRRKTMEKKYISFLLCLCMALTLMPMTVFAFANEKDFGAFHVSADADVSVDTVASYSDNVLTITDDCTITMAVYGETPTTDRIEVTSAANIILDGVDIASSGAAFKITSTAGEVNITLADNSTNTLVSGHNCAGMQKENPAQLTISCEGEGEGHNCDGHCGTLFATGGNSGAGIGGRYKASVSGITITGGNITATGNYGGAGIGGGYHGGASDITITGGTVIATGGENGAGIGGGGDGGDGSDGSDITITGGIVEATGGDYGAGIGGGYHGGASDITIYGGIVTANGRSGASGIGIGYFFSGSRSASNITIAGGTVTVNNSSGGVGIVGGGAGATGIKISGGNVLAGFGTGGAAPTNDAEPAEPVFKATFTVPDIDTDLTAVDLTIEGYNTNGIKTLNTDKVYVYLPAGDATVTYDDVDYTATVNEDGTAEFTAYMVPLAFTYSADYDIPASTVGTSIEDIDVSAGVSGGTPPYTFQSLDLPDGIEISDEGVISGTPAVADADGGTATITVTDSADSAAAESITINYGVISPGTAQAPTFNTDLSTTERVVAAGDSVTLTVAASVSDGGTVTYQWHSSDTNSAEDAEPITGETTDTYTFNASATPNDTTCYFCTATNSCSSATASANSNIQPVRTKNNVATIDTFSFTSPVAVGTVDSTADTVAVSAPAGTDVTGLTPAIVLTDSNASVSPSSGTAQDFSSPVTYTVTAEDGTTTRTYTVTVTVLTEDTYTISANPATKDFGSAMVGYSTAPAAQTITITNTGNQSVTLVQPTATGYNVTVLSGTTLATNGDTATFSIQPKTGLAAGSHNETVTVNTTSDTNAAVSVSFTVSNRSSDSGGSGSGTTKHRLTFDTNGGSSMGFLQYTEGSTVDLSHYTPTREGYSFNGWYLDEALTMPAGSVKLAKNTIVYAKWVPVGIKSYFSVSGKYKGYLDVDESNWYGTAQEGVVHDVTLLGIMEGDGDGYFRPRDGIRLSEAIKMAAVVHSIYSGDGQTFDVAAGTNWYDAYVAYAIGQDIIGPGDFEDITAYATRAEMAYLFARSLPETEIARICSLVPPDVAADDRYAEEIYLLYAAGVLTGNDEYGTFIGERGITRVEAAAIITRIALPDKRINE